MKPQSTQLQRHWCTGEAGRRCSRETRVAVESAGGEPRSDLILDQKACGSSQPDLEREEGGKFSLCELNPRRGRLVKGSKKKTIGAQVRTDKGSLVPSVDLHQAASSCLSGPARQDTQK